jgi:pilus assembly protein Flp/PilA
MRGEADRSRWASERAASAVEYAILVGLIAAVIIGTVASLGASVASSFAPASAGLGGEVTQPETEDPEDVEAPPAEDEADGPTPGRGRPPITPPGLGRGPNG